MLKFLAALLAAALWSAAAIAAPEVLRVRVTVDPAAATERPSLSGLLHGITADNPPAALVRPLQPRLFRVGRFSPELYDRVTGLGARYQLVVSDGWGYPGPRGWPFEDFAGWEAYVRQLARRVGPRPVLWDIWNEPDFKLFWRGTFAQYLETFRRAYRVLHEELGPEVQIVGPGMAWFDRGLLKRFMDHSLDHGLQIDVLSWHELSRWLIPKLAQNAAYVRRTYLQDPKYLPLGIRELQIGEYATDYDQFHPGELLAYLAAMEQAGIASAAKACWPDSPQAAKGTSNCIPLDGLVDPQTLERRAAWWLYAAYAGLGNRRLAATADDERVAALAAPTAEGVQVLVGFFQDRTTPKTADVTLLLEQTGPGPCFRPQARLIPDRGRKPLAGPLSVPMPAGAVNGRLRLPALPLHGVLQLTLTAAPCP